MQTVKDIPYLDFKHPRTTGLLMEMCLKPETVPAVISAMPMYVQTKRGVQLRVEKKLTDELQETDLKDIRVEDLCLMFPSMEIYFEDPAIPTVLLYRKDLDYQNLVKEYMKPVAFEFGRCDSVCLDHYAGMYNFTVQLPPEMMDAWLREELTDAPVMPGFIKNDEYEEQTKRFLFRLVAKVLLYASIPEYRALEVRGTDINVRKWGKPGFMNRPRTKVFRINAPTVVYTGRDHVEYDGTGTTVPHRRRGHLRRLTSEKFKAKRGTIIFIRPCLIHGGSLDDRIYMVRKKDETRKV